MSVSTAADGIKEVTTPLSSKVVIYDFARLMEGATEVKCSEFGTALVKNMEKL